MHYTVSIISLTSLTKKITPPFKTFPSTFLQPKIFYFFALYCVYADNKVTLFYYPGENTWCSIWPSRSLIEKIVNFQLVPEIRLTSNFLHRVFRLRLFQLHCFFFYAVLSVFLLAFWSCFSFWRGMMEEALSHFISSCVTNFHSLEIWHIYNLQVRH